MKSKPGASSNQIRRRCKICPHPMLIGEPALFAADPVGLSHTACIEKRRKQLAAAGAGGR